MYDIFISYSSRDKDFAKDFAEDLKSEGFSVWWDTSIPAGKTYAEVIEEALKASKSVLVLWSSNSITSDWVKLEANEGREKKVLIPVKIEDVDIPFAFKNIQAANLINWNRDHQHPDFKKLIQDINSIIGVKNKPQGNVNIIPNNLNKPNSKNRLYTSKLKKYYIPVVIFVALGAFGLNWMSNNKRDKAVIFWNDISYQNDISLFETYKEKFPNGKYIKEADSIIEDLLWASYSKLNDSLNVVKYITKYPNGRFVAEAHKKIDSIYEINKKESKKIITYGDIIYIRSLENDAQAGYLNVYEDAQCESNLYNVVVSQNRNHSGNSGQWKILSAQEKAIGSAVISFDWIYLVNMYNDGNGGYLDKCGQLECYHNIPKSHGVSTSNPNSVRSTGLTSKWKIKGRLETIIVNNEKVLNNNAAIKINSQVILDSGDTGHFLQICGDIDPKKDINDASAFPNYGNVASEIYWEIEK
ncbi:toll/interleukin-1 receptor domain-containing protein [Psychroserpens sp.]|uniref:toll/interleukin-1 receptor domain-containing protein n=1 Tax=Psychroserpens sp. TaxID=2020870 RepID=UPI002B275FC1|nr:toll/interleukin-1 receptor domain-containing protein [Psychroserpens sp.]